MRLLLCCVLSLGALVGIACVGDDPGSSGGTPDGTSSSGGGATSSSSGGSSGGGSSSGGSSSGGTDGGTCDGVFCADFEGQRAFEAWSTNSENGLVQVRDGHASPQSAGFSAVTADGGAWRAQLGVYPEVPAGRYVRLDLWFWLGPCEVNMRELAMLFLGPGQPLELRRVAGRVEVSYVGSTQQVLGFPNVVADTWTPFWIEVDRVTGTFNAAVGQSQQSGTGPIELPPDAGQPLAPGLVLGAASTVSGCVMRYDDVKISVR